MRINVLDASNYFKGLLLLIRKDKRITQPEVELLKRIGKALGFEKEFCDNAISEVLENPHIVDTPPVFSTKALAAKFIQDGLVVAFSDKVVHPLEEEWLRSAAEMNGLDMKWFSSEVEEAHRRKGEVGYLEVDGLIVTHSAETSE